MKRQLTILLLVLFVCFPVFAAPKKKKPPCAPSLDKCPVTGCGQGIDTNLNRRKNIRRAPAGAPEDMTIAQMKELQDPVPGFAKGNTRTKLAALGEGKKIRVVALALIVRPGSKESCNCGLTGAANTDNHIVLIDPADTTPSLEDDEKNSTTAEFTPRVRLTHKNLSRSVLNPLIQNAPNNALRVRVTGVLMFDSEHSFKPLAKGRANNWEIHPVFQMEFCPTGQICSDNGTSGWKKIGQ
jgi:hypothetical protein